MRKVRDRQPEKSKPSLGDRLIVYSLTAGAVLMVPQQVSATIRYIKPSSGVSVPINTGFDVDGDGTNEFTFNLAGTVVQVQPLTASAAVLYNQMWFSTYSSWMVPTSTCWWTSTGTGSTYTCTTHSTTTGTWVMNSYDVAHKLSTGFLVNSSTMSSYYWGHPPGSFILNSQAAMKGYFNGATGYLGVKFKDSNNNLVYGWIEYQGAAMAGTINEWAYEDDNPLPVGSINTGDVGSDAPTAVGTAPSTANIGETVTLDGSLSTDPNDPPAGNYASLSTITNYAWTQTGGTSVTITGGGTSPIATFVAPYVNAPSEVLSFQLTVSDTANPPSPPLSNSTTVNVTVTNAATQAPTAPFQPGTEVTDFRMGCWPVVPNGTPATGSEAFGDQIGTYDTTLMRIGYWNPDTQAYSEYPELGTIKPGWTGWFLFRNGANITLTGPPPTVATAPNGQLGYAYPLKQGWNMVGNPFNFSIDVSKIVVQDGGGWNYLTNAANTISQQVFWIYKGDYAPASILPTQTGGWVKMLSGNGTIWFPAVPVAPPPDLSDLRVIRDLADLEKPPAPPGSFTDPNSSGGGGGGGCFVSTTD